MHLGKPPHRYDLALSLAGLRRIVEYDVANLTIIAEAGVPLHEIYKLSIPKRQFLPLGFPGTTASLGGLLVTNTSGVKRARYGSLRDLLLGVRVVLPDGSFVRFGGRVVKNVAGYDMNKLFVGSLGVFGVVLETTYRLAALPEDDRVLAVVFPTLSQATVAAAAVQGSQLQPSALMLLSAGAAAACSAVPQLPGSAERVVLLLNFDGTHEAVERQVRDSRALCQQHGGVTEVLITGEALFKLWEFQEAWRAAPADADRSRLQVRLGALASHLEDAVQCLTRSQMFSQQHVRWLADYSSGQIFAHLPLHQPMSSDLGSRVQSWLLQLRTQARDWHGYCVIEYAPAPLQEQLDVWGESPGDQLLRLYKQHFDPHAVLNPGRYLAGL
jgi:glycolate oxidase FAD binding subunit